MKISRMEPEKGAKFSGFQGAECALRVKKRENRRVEGKITKEKGDTRFLSNFRDKK